MEGQAKRAYACVQHTCNTSLNMFPCAYSVLFSLKPGTGSGGAAVS